MKYRWITNLIILLVSLHSLVVGIILLFFSDWLLPKVSWNLPRCEFWQAQTGVFLIVLASAYLCGVWKRLFAWFIVYSKGIALIFLIYAMHCGIAPKIMHLTTVADALMGLALFITLQLESNQIRQTVKD